MGLIRRLPVSVVVLVVLALVVPAASAWGQAAHRTHKVHCRRGHKRVRRHHHFVCVRRHHRPAQPISSGPTGGRQPAPGAPPLPPPPPPPPPLLRHAGQIRAAFSDGPGLQHCEGSTIGINAPLVDGFSPNGQYLWVYDELDGAPSDQTGDPHAWRNSGYDWWYTGSLGGPPTGWTNYYSGRRSSDLNFLDWWDINPGWTVTIIQYVYADGYWQWNVPSLQSCVFT